MRHVKLDMTHEDYDSALETCAAAFAASYPRNLMASIEATDGSACWVKTTVDADVVIGGAVLDIQDGSADRVWADNRAWNPPPGGVE